MATGTPENSKPIAISTAPSGNLEANVEGKSEETTDADLLALAAAQFKQCVDAFAENRLYQLDDQRFRAASPDDAYQWPTDIATLRRSEKGAGARPMLTINKLPAHVNQIVNDWKINRPQFKVSPVDDKADPKVAEIINGVLRDIQLRSDADVAYDSAIDGAAVSGEGFIRVLTDYAAPDSFDQEIRIQRVRNPLSVFMDPFIQHPAGADQRFCFVVDDLPPAVFKAEWPDHDPESWGPALPAFAEWTMPDRVRVAEWWNIESEKRTLCQWANGSTSWEGDSLPPGAVVGERPVRTREVDVPVVMFRRITSGAILETVRWPGRKIPIARAVGNEYDVGGRLIVNGLVRTAKDAQRMYNYWASQETEMLALAPKAPFVAAKGQLDGFETQWQQANVVNYAALLYNPFVKDPQGNMHALPAPQRAQPPQVSSGILQAKLGAADDIKSTTGQYDASLGQRSNETSGKAIMARQREGDIGTYQYADGTRRALREIGRIIVDLIPHVYTRAGIQRIIGEDGAADFVKIDPSQQQAVVERKNEVDGTIERIYNLNVGRYDLTVETGPSYTTKRQETAETLTSIVQADRALMRVIGDKVLGALDLTDADTITKRMRAYQLPEVIAAEEAEDGAAGPQIPPELQQQIQTAMQEHQAALARIQELEAQAESKQREIAIKEEQAKADAYRAETERLKLLLPLLPLQQASLLAQQVFGATIGGPDLGGGASVIPDAGIPGLPPGFDPGMLPPGAMPAPAGGTGSPLPAMGAPSGGAGAPLPDLGAQVMQMGPGGESGAIGPGMPPPGI